MFSLYNDKKIMMKTYDVIVVGLGAGGVGASLTLALEKNLKVAVVEKEDVGGTMVIGGVNCFEPGIAIGHIQESLCKNLLNKGLGKVQKSIEGYPCENNPYAISVDYNSPYESTLRRGSLDQRTQCRRFMFDDKAMQTEILSRLEKSNVDLYVGYKLVSSSVINKNIEQIEIENKQGEKATLKSRFFIDCTSDVSLAYASGCKTTIGQESKAVYGEEIAPAVSRGEINGVSLVFRISKNTETEFKFDDNLLVDVTEWEENLLKKNNVYFCANQYPNGDYNINMLPTMTGKEFFSMPYEDAYKICYTRVKKLSEHLVSYERFKDYRLKYVFPMIGIREDRRIVGKYVMTLKDILCSTKENVNRNYVAYADHIIDMHGCEGERPPITHPYGIPYECLQTNEVDNLLVASKGSSFSHIVASSCRLSRTIMDMGESAGNACKLAINQNKKLSQVQLNVDIFDGYESIGTDII